MISDTMRRVLFHSVAITAFFGAAPAFSAPSPDEKQAIEDAVRAQLQTSDVEIDGIKVSAPKGCNIAGASVAGDHQRRTWTFKVAGVTGAQTPCEGWAWAQVKQMGTAYVATRTLAPGDVLDGAFKEVRQPLRAGDRLATRIPVGSIARGRIAKGQALHATDVVSAGPSIGASLSIRLRAGTLVVAGNGVRVPCTSRDESGAVCARTGAGARVAGEFHDGALWVQR